MVLTKYLLSRPAALGMAALAMLAIAPAAHGSEFTPSFPMLSLGKGQTAQLIAYPTIPNTPVPCSIVLKFHGQDNQLLVDRAGDEIKEVTIVNGVFGASLLLPFNVAILSDDGCDSRMRSGHNSGGACCRGSQSCQKTGDRQALLKCVLSRSCR